MSYYNPHLYEPSYYSSEPIYDNFSGNTWGFESLTLNWDDFPTVEHSYEDETHSAGYADETGFDAEYGPSNYTENHSTSFHAETSSTGGDITPQEATHHDALIEFESSIY